MVHRDPLEPRHVDVPGLEPGEQHGEIRDVLEDQAVEVRADPMIPWVRLERDVVAGLALHELERPRADGFGVERVSVQVRGGAEDVLGHDVRIAPQRDHGRVRLRKRQFHGVGVGRLERRDPVIPRPRRRVELGVHDGAVGERHVGGGERRAVVPGRAPARLDSVLQAVLGDPAVLHGRDLGGQVGDELPLCVHPPQGIEDAHVDAPVHFDVSLERVEHRGLLREADDYLSALSRRARRPPQSAQRRRGRDTADTAQGRHQELAPFHPPTPSSPTCQHCGTIHLADPKGFPC